MEEIKTTPVTQPEQEQAAQQQAPGITIQEALASFDPNDKNKALLILVNATRVAQSKGIYTLEEAELISKAIRAFMIPAPEGPKHTGA
jgi:hypothetical protein